VSLLQLTNLLPSSIDAREMLRKKERTLQLNRLPMAIKPNRHVNVVKGRANPRLTRNQTMRPPSKMTRLRKAMPNPSIARREKRLKIKAPRKMRSQQPNKKRKSLSKT
jgi:hypothetical protein